MARQKIVRRKITVTIPYKGLEEGHAAVQAMKAAALKTKDGWGELLAVPGAEIDFGEIEETSREL